MLQNYAKFESKHFPPWTTDLFSTVYRSSLIIPDTVLK